MTEQEVQFEYADLAKLFDRIEFNGTRWLHWKATIACAISTPSTVPDERSLQIQKTEFLSRV